MRRILARAAEWILTTHGRMSWGLAPALAPAIVDHLGPFGTLRWLFKHIPGYERTVKALGPTRANLVFALASLLNGCAYCVYAHARAFQLHYFKERDQLFPLDEHQLISLSTLDDAEIHLALEHALTVAGIEEDAQIIRRLHRLKLEGARPTEPNDEYLLHAIRMYDVLNFCAISSQTPLDDAHDPINKDEALKARYAEARLNSPILPLLPAASERRSSGT